MHWRLRALCRGRDPEDYDLTFSKDLGEDETRDSRARALCEGCPVMVECAAEALEPLAVGTVRAGVWIPDWGRTRRRTTARQRLEEIVAHGLIAEA